jgi:hypothetical protein
MIVWGSFSAGHEEVEEEIMKETDFREVRQRWQDGTMSVDEWTKAIEDHLAKDKEKSGVVGTVPTERETKGEISRWSLIPQSGVYRYLFLR